MNIMSALLPNGQSEDLTPYAFNELLVNATTLLQRMQSAYKEKVDYIATMQPEIEVQREEVEEAETRSRHLKLQLQDMGRRAQEQESAMQELASQLSQERFRHQEAKEKEARKASSRSFRPVPPPPASLADETTDDETTPRSRYLNNSKRVSGGSTDASDSGFESDLDRDWSQDPLSPSMQRAVLSSPVAPPITPTKVRPGSHQHAPLTGSGLRNSVKRLGSDGSAWAVMERLRVENVELKRRVGDMQKELQGCIELIGLVGI